MLLTLTIATTVVALALSGLAAFAGWHFNKQLFALFPPPPPDNRGIIAALIELPFDILFSAVDGLSKVVFALIYAVLVGAGCIIAAVTLPWWAIIPVGLAVATLPATLVCGIVVGLSHFGPVWQAIAAWLYRVAARFTGFAAAILDSIALLFTSLPAFLDRIKAISGRAGDSVRNAIVHDHA